MRKRGSMARNATHNQAAKSENETGGRLYVVATPIGNLEDITLRALRILAEVDLIAAEDTRHTRKLLSHFDIHTKQISYHKEKEAARADEIIEILKTGRNVALVSDAGTPAISDPGAILVDRTRAAGLEVVPIPGPAALTAALSVAGLGNDPFVFLGFLPGRVAQRRNLLTTLTFAPQNIVFYEAPHRIPACLQDCLEIFGDRPAFWGRELTKIHEELITGPLSALIATATARQAVKGESVLIISKAAPENKTATTDLVELLTWYRDHSDLSLKDAVRKIADDLGQPRSRIYQEALKIWL